MTMHSSLDSFVTVISDQVWYHCAYTSSLLSICSLCQE